MKFKLIVELHSYCNSNTLVDSVSSQLNLKKVNSKLKSVIPSEADKTNPHSTLSAYRWRLFRVILLEYFPHTFLMLGKVHRELDNEAR